MAFIGDMFDRLKFANLYIQQAIEWSHNVAEGNYGAVEDEIQNTQATMVDVNKANEIRIGAFLSALSKMVQGVKDREENLKQQLMTLTIEIDEQKREQEVDDLSNRSFFFRIQDTADEIRKRRKKRAETRNNMERPDTLDN